MSSDEQGTALDVLRAAYDAFFAEAAAGGFSDPSPGEWSASEVVAHIAVNDGGLIAVSAALARNETMPFENSVATDSAHLSAAVHGQSLGALIDRGRASSAELIGVLGALSDEQFDTEVPCRLLDGGRIGFEGSMSWRQLVLQIHPAVHLAGHTAQLRALRR